MGNNHDKVLNRHKYTQPGDKKRHAVRACPRNELKPEIPEEAEGKVDGLERQGVPSDEEPPPNHFASVHHVAPLQSVRQDPQVLVEDEDCQHRRDRFDVQHPGR